MNNMFRRKIKIALVVVTVLINLGGANKVLGAGVNNSPAEDFLVRDSYESNLKVCLAATGDMLGIITMVFPGFLCFFNFGEPARETEQKNELISNLVPYLPDALSYCDSGVITDRLFNARNTIAHSGRSTLDSSDQSNYIGFPAKRKEFKQTAEIVIALNAIEDPELEGYKCNAPEIRNACTNLDFSRSISTGTWCLTSKGERFDRLVDPDFGKAWRSPDGMIWSDTLGQVTSLEQALAICEKYRAKLPSLAEFEQSNQFRLRETLPKSTNEMYWNSNSIYEDPTTPGKVDFIVYRVTGSVEGNSAHYGKYSFMEHKQADNDRKISVRCIK